VHRTDGISTARPDDVLDGLGVETVGLDGSPQRRLLLDPAMVH
jgi:hypothetical protein